MRYTDLRREELFTGGHSACPGCGAAIAIRQALKALGPKTIMVIPASCAATIGGSNQATAWRVPFVHSLFECSAAVASGVRASLDIRGQTGINVVSWAGDAGSADIGFQALSGAAERNEDIIHVCYDNEVYMNTGGQAGSLTPHRVTTPDTPSGKPTGKKDLLAIMRAHRVPYVASASIAYPLDFIAKLEKAMAKKGFRYLQVLAPCPQGWQYPAERTVEVARLATECGLWPLYEFEDGVERLTQAPERQRPVGEYVRAQRRYDRLSDADLALIQAGVDAARGGCQ